MDSAEDKNLILFNKMARNMVAGDFENFRQTTSIMTTWLTKREAYYPTALVQVLRLLYIAQFRVVNEVKLGHGLKLPFRAQPCSQNPFAAEYIKLINSTTPFQHVFLAAEKGLRDGYQRLVASVSSEQVEIEAVPQKIESKNDLSVTCVQLLAAHSLSTAPTSTSIDSEQIGGITTLDSPPKSDTDVLLELSQEEQLTNDFVGQNLPSPVGSSPGVGVVASTDSPQQGLDQQNLTESAGFRDVAMSNSPNSNAVLGSAVTQMEVDFMEVQNQSEESQDHSTGNGVASMETSGVPSEAFHNESNAMEVDGLGVVESTFPSNPASRQLPNEDTESMNLAPSPPSRKMGIVARQQGLNGSYRILIDFEITPPQFGLIKQWSKRSGSLVELESSICITLGCYLVADLEEQSETRRLSSFEQQITCTPVKWPQHPGRLSLKVISADSKEENLPLSPPFQVTPDNLLDISGLLAEGRNRLQLHQTADLRHFLFVLHAHHPTPRQLQQVEGHMRKKKEWQQFLEDFTSPLAYDSLTSLLSN